MHPTLKFFSVLAFALSLNACTATPEYPGVKTNVKIGQFQKMKSYEVRSQAPQAAPQGLLSIKESPTGDQSICVGAWCSCQTD